MSPYKNPEDRKRYHKEYGARHYRENKEAYKARLCTPERNLKRRIHTRLNRTKLARMRRIKKYGSMVGFDRVLKILDTGIIICECCGSSDPQSVKGWCVDHCHKDNFVRGILCVPCNLTIGIAKECQNRLESVLKYLKRFTERKPEDVLQ